MGGELVFLKLSGMVLDDSASRGLMVASLKRLAAARPEDLFYVFCGGGSRVDALREKFEWDKDGICKEWQERSGQSTSPQEAAHWLATGIMDRNGKEMQQACRDVENLIFPPVTRLLREREGLLPRSWEVTSDSITYALAVALACDPAFPRIILLKDVDGALRVHATRGGLPRRSRDARGTLVRRILVRSQRPRPALPTYPFDEFMFALVEEYQQPFFIVNWRRIDRVLELLENGRTPFCTAVMPG